MVAPFLLQKNNKLTPFLLQISRTFATVICKLKICTIEIY
jgi:hypothetical protein